MQNRLKSPVVWTGILTEVCNVIAMFNPNISNKAKIICTAVITILLLLGILNNPTNKEGF